MVRETRELQRKGGSTSMISWRVPLLGSVLLLTGALLLGGCPKKREVETGGAGAIGGPGTEVARVPEEWVEPGELITEAPLPPVVGEAPTEAPLQDVFFDFDKSALREDGKQALDENLIWLNANPGLRVGVEGHCDEQGTNEYNLALGERRAKVVRDYLVAGGVDSSRISTISYGEERPFVLGHDESAWQWNRRGHFVVVE